MACMTAFSKGCDRFLRTMFFVLFCFTFLCNWRNVEANQNYRDALAKSILFFQGQRSGRLPPQEITWRADSGLSDGHVAGVDLTGGYYDAGDNVKFNFPMAFTATMLSWSAIEYGHGMGDQLESTRTAIKWATGYLLKCAALATRGMLYVGVGNPNTDHQCWERPEDMDTDRSAYFVSASKPGSDVAGETAAALAAASIVFRNVDRAYSERLLKTAKSVMGFAMKYRGAYSDSLGSTVCPFYCSYSGYNDELLWGAAWLFKATNLVYYLNFIRSLEAGDDANIFSWDNKYPGAHVLLARRSLVNNDPTFQPYRQQAEDFMCSILPKRYSPSSSTQYTQGGLMFKMDGSNLQYVTSISFLLTTYAKYMAASKHTFNCGNVLVTQNTLRTVVKTQVDYILGNNPKQMSYMVGYGSKFPQRIHHRGSSLPSRKDHPKHIECQAGYTYYNLQSPNPNILTGAIVGGPDYNDDFKDDRTDYSHSEPTTYINAAFVGTLASLLGTID